MTSVVFSLLPNLGSTSSVIGRGGKCVHSSLKRREEAGTWRHLKTKVTNDFSGFLHCVFDVAFLLIKSLFKYQGQGKIFLQ